MTTSIVKTRKVSEQALKSSYLRHYQALASFNYERQQSNAYCYAMIPALKELYADDEQQYIEALKRHLEFFNTTCACIPFVLGISIAMEEQYSSTPDEMDVGSINSVKASLMGPLAGIGDSFFWGTFRTIGVGIGAPMAVAMNVFGPIFYFLINLIPSTFVRMEGFKLGYKGGTSFLNKISEDGTLAKTMETAKIVGLTVIGGMIANMVKVTTPLTINFGGTSVIIQNILDSIMPNLLPLSLTFICYKLLKKNVDGIYIMLGMLFIGIFGKFIGLF